MKLEPLDIKNIGTFGAEQYLIAERLLDQVIMSEKNAYWVYAIAATIRTVNW